MTGFSAMAGPSVMPIQHAAADHRDCMAGGCGIVFRLASRSVALAEESGGELGLAMAESEPSSEESTERRGRKSRFTPEQRDEIVRRVEAGDVRAAIARDYGVSREAISQIYIRMTTSDEERRPSLRRRKLLTDDELAQFEKLLETTVPKDHDLHLLGPGHPDFWSEDRARALMNAKFGKNPAAHVMKKCLSKHRNAPEYDPDQPPPPPLPHDIRRLSPEMAANEEFVEYYLSKKAWELTLREHELAVREWEKDKAKRDAARAKKAAEEPPPPPPAREPLAPGMRVGKHRASKGSPFTKPKRRKKR